MKDLIIDIQNELHASQLTFKEIAEKYGLSVGDAELILEEMIANLTE